MHKNGRKIALGRGITAQEVGILVWTNHSKLAFRAIHEGESGKQGFMTGYIHCNSVKYQNQWHTQDFSQGVTFLGENLSMEQSGIAQMK